MATRNIFDREKRQARRERYVALCAWACFVALLCLALDGVGATALLS